MNGDRKIADDGPANTGKRNRTTRKLRRNETTLAFPPDIFSDNSLQGLVNDLLVPLIVDCLLRRATKK